MGVMQKIKAALGFPVDEPALESSAPPHSRKKEQGAGRLAHSLEQTLEKNAYAPKSVDRRTIVPETPIAIDLADVDDHAEPLSAGDSSIDLARSDSADLAGDRPLSSKKARQEMLTELQKNYKEVLELVRRVQTHLDTQEARSARLMEIVERIPDALDDIPERRAQTERLITAVEKVAEVGRTSHDVSQQSFRELAKANEQLARSARADDELVSAMGEFKVAAESMAADNQRAAGAVRDMARRSAERDEQLAEAVADGRRWLVIGVTVTAVAAAFAVILSVLALVT